MNREEAYREWFRSVRGAALGLDDAQCHMAFWAGCTAGELAAHDTGGSEKRDVYL